MKHFLSMFLHIVKLFLRTIVCTFVKKTKVDDTQEETGDQLKEVPKHGESEQGKRD